MKLWKMMKLIYKVIAGFFLHFLCNSIVNSPAAAAAVCDPKESFALMKFKNTFSLDQDASSYYCNEYYGQISYPKTETWNESKDCCLWDGVECEAGHVIGLDLSCSWLRGGIHPDSTLFMLFHLQSLNLAFNDFQSFPISSQFGRISNLRFLNLSSSYFKGEVPLEISQLSKLISLDLSIFPPPRLLLPLPPPPLLLPLPPPPPYRQLRIQNLVWNKLVHNLTNLRDLVLDGVNLFEIRPISLTNLSLSLESLCLNDCKLVGNFPIHIFSHSKLRELQVSNNYELNGYFPKSNWSKSLEILKLYSTNFSGYIPNIIGKIKSMKYLDIYNCKFNGPIPETIGNLTQLINLDLSRNEFNGKIPSTIANMDQLSTLIAYDNLLSGPLPTCIPSRAILPNLVELDLSHNSLNDTIPSWIYALPRLRFLNLQQNQFIGFIKDFRFNSLEILGLRGNNLKDGIPESIYRQENLTALTLRSNNLIIILNLDMLVKMKYLRSLDLSNNKKLSFYPSNITNYSSVNLQSISMASSKLTEFPYFRYFKNLKYLDLSNNLIEGNVPSWLPELGALSYLNFSHNLLSAGINVLPLTKLEYVFLDFNLFKQPIPTPPPSIQFFSASNNQFFGKIYPSICLATNLTILNLSNNSLSGTIPSCLVNMTLLSVLDLKRNNFSGIIPTTFSNESQLTNIDLNGNQIEGELPQSLLQCENLEVLDVGNNKITGTFPHWLEALPSLRVLILRSNRFYGSIKNSMTTTSFPKLQIMDLAHNRFSGVLPSQLFQNLDAMEEIESEGFISVSWSTTFYDYSVMVTVKGTELQLERNLWIFKAIDLSNNNFSGEIPKSIGMLISLKGLNLSHNKLTGEIPTSFGNLTNLEWLDLSSNRLSGNIPNELVGLTFLSVLNLSQNQLSGRIPQGNQFGSFGNSSYFGNSGLCGFSLPTCDEDKNKDPTAVKNEEEEEAGCLSIQKVFQWKVVLMGYGCGMVYGIFVGYVVFRTGRPAWIVEMVESRNRARKMKMSKRKARPSRSNNNLN